MDKILMAIRVCPDDEVKGVLEQILKIFTSKGKIPLSLQKEINKLPPALKENIIELAKEFEATGGGISLDFTKVSKEDQKILNEKPPPVRKFDDLKKDRVCLLII